MNRDRGDGIIRRKVTYVDWTEGGAHPKAFSDLTQDIVDKDSKKESQFLQENLKRAQSI